MWLVGTVVHLFLARRPVKASIKVVEPRYLCRIRVESAGSTLKHIPMSVTFDTLLALVRHVTYLFMMWNKYMDFGINSCFWLVRRALIIFLAVQSGSRTGSNHGNLEWNIVTCYVYMPEKVLLNKLVHLSIFWNKYLTEHVTRTCFLCHWSFWPSYGLSFTKLMGY